MPTTQRPIPEELERRLNRRQQLADAAVAALAHGRRRADTLYDQVSELEDNLERDHPNVVARLFGEWVTRDADQLAGHQADTAPDCTHCAAVRAQQHPAQPHALTA